VADPRGGKGGNFALSPWPKKEERQEERKKEQKKRKGRRGEEIKELGEDNYGFSDLNSKK